MNIPTSDEGPRRYVRTAITILAVCLAFYGLYFAFKAIGRGFTHYDEKRAVNIVTSRNLLPSPTPEIQIKEVPVVDPALQDEIKKLQDEVKSLR